MDTGSITRPVMFYCGDCNDWSTFSCSVVWSHLPEKSTLCSITFYLHLNGLWRPPNTLVIFFFLFRPMSKYSHVEALQLHSNTQSHWSSGSTVCFPPGRADVCVLGMHPHLQQNRVLLLAMSRYIGDPDPIPDHRLR
jgi:hypothetical protein